MTRAQAIDMILIELDKAEAKHQSFPIDPIHAAGILVEKAGEAMQAALDFSYTDVSREALRCELAQAGAMAIRNLLHLYHFQRIQSAQVVVR